MLWPKEAAKFIASRAQDVKISEEGIKNCAKIIATAVKHKKLNIESFRQNEVLPLDKNLSKEQLANWVFLVDSLNFSFWTPKGAPKYTVTRNGKQRPGYLAMVSAINRALDEGKPIYDPHYYSKLSIEELKTIFRSDTESSMPLYERRVEVMSEVGHVLLTKFEGNFINVLQQAEGSALKLVGIVINEFPCFRDIHLYEGKEVAILKRAQILAADIWLLYQGQGLGKFTDIDALSMFADYRVPQALVHFGAIFYSSSLMDKLEKDYLFTTGDREEVEIRGVSIHATELIVEEVREILKEWNEPAQVNSIKVDFFLWDFRLENSVALDVVPYHKVRCIYY